MSDKRKVTTDALETLGTLIDEKAGRDAIHLAVEPVTANCSLSVGEDIGIELDGTATNRPDIKKVGIVDPFLKQAVKAGERFWLIVYPRTITSLRHVWEHPDFTEKDNTVAKAVSEQWLRDFCETADCPRYEELIRLVDTGGSHNDEDDDFGCYIDEEYLHFSGTDAHGSIPAEFWNHMEIVTGKKMSLRPAHFSCSC